MAKETKAAAKADIKPFSLGSFEKLAVGSAFTVGIAGGDPVTVTVTQEILDEGFRLGVSTALQNRYASAKEKGWATASAKGEQSAILARHWAESGTWSMERKGGGLDRAAVERATVEKMIAEINAMDLPEAVKATLRAKFAA